MWFNLFFNLLSISFNLCYFLSPCAAKMRTVVPELITANTLWFSIWISNISNPFVKRYFLSSHRLSFHFVWYRHRTSLRKCVALISETKCLAKSTIHLQFYGLLIFWYLTSIITTHRIFRPIYPLLKWFKQKSFDLAQFQTWLLRLRQFFHLFNVIRCFVTLIFFTHSNNLYCEKIPIVTHFHGNKFFFLYIFRIQTFFKSSCMVCFWKVFNILCR